MALTISYKENMNTQLYNSLTEAREFLITIEKNENDLKRQKLLIREAYVNPYILPPNEKPKKINWVIFFVLFFLNLGIFSIIYALYIRSYNKKINKKQQVYDKSANSPEEQKRKSEAMEKREKLNAELEKKTVEYKMYYSENYLRKLGFLTECIGKIETVDDISHGIKYIDGLIHYVKYGAKNLDEAMRLYGEDLREIEKHREEKEYREQEEAYRKHLDKQHQDEIDVLNKIAQNQEKTKSELERIRQRYVDRW